jgi:hypothetical protein
LVGRFSDQESRVTNIIRTVITFQEDKSWTYDEYVSHSQGGPETRVVSILFKRA